MTTPLNLRELALERPKSAPPGKPRKTAWLSRSVIPGVIAAGFLGLMAWALRDQLVSRKPVTVVPVIVTRAEIQQEGTSLFQAAGWIEPRPTPVTAAALTEGVVEALLVVEGQSVRAGDPVAKLIAIDAQLALQEAQARLALQDAELHNAGAELKGARLRREHPVHLEAQLADAEALLAKTQTGLAKLPHLIEQTTSRLEYARSNVKGKRSAGAGIAARSLQLAESEYAAVQAELRELQERQPNLQREAEALEKKKVAVQQQLTLLVEETRQVESAQAKQQAAKAQRDQAQLAVDKAQLALDRTVVRSPIDGRVMQLVAHPGTRVMGMESSGARGASTVVTLYDPRMLQVRADVRLEDVPMVQPGQPVTLETASSKVPLSGTVLRATSSANIQKNTLEVKIEIDQPPDTIRPEMLVTATFLAPPQPKSEQSAAQETERILIPRQLVDTASGTPTVWIVTAEGTARRQSVTLGKAGTDQLMEVQGLTLTDKLVSGGREGLYDGERLEVTGEDPSLGLSVK